MLLYLASLLVHLNEGDMATVLVSLFKRGVAWLPVNLNIVGVASRSVSPIIKGGTFQSK